jgi:phosphotransferase system IIA component
MDTDTQTPIPVDPNANMVVAPSESVIEDVAASTNAYIAKHDKKYIVAYIALIVIVLAGVIFMRLNLGFLLVALAIGFVGYFHVQSRFEHEFILQFGASIGFSYSPSADMDTVSGKMFSLGHGQNISNVLSGTKDGRDSRIYLFRFTIGYGKGSQTYSYTVFETTFSNVMPDIVLTPHESVFLRDALSHISGEHVQLEGDFNKYFTVTVSKGYETEAYQILTADIMVDLIDKAKGMCFEFDANKLYIFTYNQIDERAKFQAMFDLAEWLDTLFNRSTRAVNITVPTAQNV